MFPKAATATTIDAMLITYQYVISEHQMALDEWLLVGMSLVLIYIKWDWSLLGCGNDWISNLHQTYSAISVIHTMLKQNFSKHLNNCFSHMVS